MTDMVRRQAIDIVFEQVGGDDLVLTTTGLISRESFASHDRPGNFYMIGSMGLLSSIGLGLALLKPSRRVFVLEGDGSALMSLGAIPLIATEAPRNLLHVILDNEAYESTGGQPSITSRVDLAGIAEAAGYARSVAVRTENELRNELAVALAGTGPNLVLAKVGISSGHDLPRVAHSPVEIRDRFIAAAKKGASKMAGAIAGANAGA